jgi:hypothetical protein
MYTCRLVYTHITHTRIPHIRAYNALTRTRTHTGTHTSTCTYNAHITHLMRSHMYTHLHTSHTGIYTRSYNVYAYNVHAQCTHTMYATMYLCNNVTHNNVGTRTMYATMCMHTMYTHNVRNNVWLPSAVFI